MKLELVSQIIQRQWKKYKWFWIIIIFLTYITFIDSYNILKIKKLQKEVAQLTKTKQQLLEQIEQDSLTLYKFKTQPNFIRDYAREKYYFHSPNEDVYLIKSEKK